MNPAAHQSPAGERDAKRHDPHEQVFPEPGKRLNFSVGDFAEEAVGKNPTGVEADGQEERARLQPRVPENTSNRKEREQAARDEQRADELGKRMAERDEAGHPIDGVVRRNLLRGFHEMNGRKKR